MHIEIWESGHGKAQHWRWHFKARNGRIVADAEAFPTKAHAMRAAKAAVRAILKPCGEPEYFRESKSRSGRIVLRWS